MKAIGVWNWTLPAWAGRLPDGRTYNTCPSASIDRTNGRVTRRLDALASASAEVASAFSLMLTTVGFAKYDGRIWPAEAGGMEDSSIPARDVTQVTLPKWGKVIVKDSVVPFQVIGDDGTPVAPIESFLLDFVVCGNRPSSVRSYAYVLLRWWRFLLVIDVAWDKATPDDSRDLVLWLMQATKPVADDRTISTVTAGTINPLTRKQYLDDSYKPRTIRHNNAVVRSFYEYFLERGLGPVTNPVPLDRARSAGRPNAHRSPLEPARLEGRLRYNPPVPRRKPRSLSDQHWLEFFGALRSHRDRAVVSLAVSTAARAGELLGLRRGDVDWGEQLVRVVRKGSCAEQWLPASPESFVWLRLYLADDGQLDLEQPLWLSLRRRGPNADSLVRVPMNYDALRAVIRRANTQLGTNWTMHDLRHTAALRMSRDKNLSVTDIQTILGHAHLATTQTYLDEDDDAVISRVRRHLTDIHDKANVPTPPPHVGSGYDPADLSVLFGTDQQ